EGGDPEQQQPSEQPWVPASAGTNGEDKADRAPPPAAKEPWGHRLMRTLLYGREVDRSAKARARISLVILIFTLVYAVIAGRLVVFATTPESHGYRRGGQDALATARPDILDRNGQILATDVRTP